MKIHTVRLFALFTGAALLAGCTTSGVKPPVNAPKDSYETTAKFTLMDARAQYSVTCTGIQERRIEDGRLEVAANVRNRENRRIEVQAQCLFKDPQGFALDETPWQTLILTENGQDTLRFTSMNNKAMDYEVRVRGSR